MVKVNILYLSLFLFSSFVISQADDLTEELVVTGTLIKAKEVRIINSMVTQKLILIKFQMHW